MLWYYLRTLCPAIPSVLSQPRSIRSIEVQCRQAVFPSMSLNGSVLCSVFLSSPLCLISHLAFPLCAALVIVFLWSTLAFDMQTPKALAALQINCLSQQYSLSLTLSISLCLFVCLYPVFSLS